MIFKLCAANMPIVSSYILQDLVNLLFQLSNQTPEEHISMYSWSQWVLTDF